MSNIIVDDLGRAITLTKDSDTQRLRGLECIRSNISVVNNISQFLRTSLGPVGSDKILQDSDGGLIITNDGATILKNMDLSHPVAKLVLQLSESMDDEVGDGTTSVVIFASSLLSKALELLDKGIHPVKISEGYEVACSYAINCLRTLSESFNSCDKEVLINAAKTSLCSKIVNNSLDLFASISVEAVLQVIDKERKDLDFDLIKIESRIGSDLSKSKLINGVIINKEFSHGQMIKEIKNAKIAILTCPFEPPKIKTKHTLNITSVDDYKKLADYEIDKFKGMIQKLKDVGANVVVCQWGFDDEANSLLMENNIPAIRWVGGHEIEQIAMHTNGRIISRFEDLKEIDLGTGNVKEISIGTENERVILIENYDNYNNNNILCDNNTNNNNNNILCDNNTNNIADNIIYNTNNNDNVIYNTTNNDNVIYNTNNNNNNILCDNNTNNIADNIIYNTNNNDNVIYNTNNNDNVIYNTNNNDNIIHNTNNNNIIYNTTNNDNVIYNTNNKDDITHDNNNGVTNDSNDNNKDDIIHENNTKNKDDITHDDSNDNNNKFNINVNENRDDNNVTNDVINNSNDNNPVNINENSNDVNNSNNVNPVVNINAFAYDSLILDKIYKDNNLKNIEENNIKNNNINCLVDDDVINNAITNKEYSSNNRKSKTVTIYVRGGTEMIIEEAKRSIRDALCAVRNTITNNKIVYGGGSAEIATSIALQETALKTKDAEEGVCMLAFAKALEEIPFSLARNSGLNAVDCISEIRVRQVTENNSFIGVNIEDENGACMKEKKIFDSLNSKIKQYSMANQLVNMVLKIDDIISGKE